MSFVIDSDQHLVEYRGLWEEHIDPGARDEAIRFVDDDAGYTWVTWRDQRLGLAEVQTPGETDEIGQRHERARRGEPGRAPLRRRAPARPLGSRGPPATGWPISAWTRRCCSRTTACCGSASSRARRRALLANMRAWNRWCVTVAAEGRGRLHPVAHLSLRDPDWMEQELRRPGRGWGPARDDRSRGRGREAALPPGARPGVGRVRRARDHPGVPRGRPDTPVRRRLVHRR